MTDRVTYGAVHVEGLRDLSRTFSRISVDARRELRGYLKDAALPVQERAQELAVEKVRNIGDRWSHMRIGVTTSIVYIAEKQRGLKGPHPRRRPNLAGLLIDRAMQPALEENRARVIAILEHGLDQITAEK